MMHLYIYVGYSSGTITFLQR